MTIALLQGSKTSNHLEMALRVEGDGEAKKGDGLKYDIGQDNTIALPTMVGDYSYLPSIYSSYSYFSFTLFL